MASPFLPGYLSGPTKSDWDLFQKLNAPAVIPGTGRSDYGAAPAGALQGAGSGAGSPATGFIPFAPDPAATSAKALATNLASIPALQGLFSGVANTYIPGATQKFAQESANVDELLNPGRLIDTDRYSAETNAARGIAGSPAGFSSAVRRRDDEILRRQLLGSQLLSSISQRGEGILPLPQFMITPDQQQQWQYLANQLAAAPNPAEAYNLAGTNAALGLQAGMRAGYGRGGGGASAPSYLPSFYNPTATQSNTGASAVVNKYGPSIGLSPSTIGTENGVLGIPEGTGEFKGPRGTLRIDNAGNFSWPYATPIPDEFLPNWQEPIAPQESNFYYDWANP